MQITQAHARQARKHSTERQRKAKDVLGGHRARQRAATRSATPHATLGKAGKTQKRPRRSTQQRLKCRTTGQQQENTRENARKCACKHAKWRKIKKQSPTSANPRRNTAENPQRLCPLPWHAQDGSERRNDRDQGTKRARVKKRAPQRARSERTAKCTQHARNQSKALLVAVGSAPGTRQGARGPAAHNWKACSW